GPLVHAHLIVNPAAGRGAAARALDPIVREFRRQGWGVEAERTARPGDGVELAARAVRAGARHVVAVGGDGTVHEVANGLLHATGRVEARHGAPLLGVVPIGTGNDFAKLVGVYGHAPVRAVQRLVTARPVKLDVCVVRRVSLARFLLAVPRVMRGTHGTMREVALFQTRSLTLRSLEGPLVLHLDGELREPDARHCTVRVEPGKLNVLVAQ